MNMSGNTPGNFSCLHPGGFLPCNGNEVSHDLANLVPQLLSSQVHILDQLVEDTSGFPVDFEPSGPDLGDPAGNRLVHTGTVI